MGIDRPDAGVSCRWCGEVHGERCPWVKALEFDTGGEQVQRVEFFSPVEIFGPHKEAVRAPVDGVAYPKLGS